MSVDTSEARKDAEYNRDCGRYDVAELIDGMADEIDRLTEELRVERIRSNARAQIIKSKEEQEPSFQTRYWRLLKEVPDREGVHAANAILTDEIDSLRSQLAEARAAKSIWHDGPARNGKMPENPEEGERIAIVYESATGRLWMDDLTQRDGQWLYTAMNYRTCPIRWHGYPIHRWCRFADLHPAEAEEAEVASG